jgi:hypothetical protein
MDIPMREPTEIIQRFDLKSGHTLKLQSHHKIGKDGTTYETIWYDEHNESNKLVSRFRAWVNQGNNPPYRRQTGWEQYSLSGNLLDREVSYSKREDLTYLH